MQLLGVADLVARWVYTKQGIHRLIRTDDFPKPCAQVNQGRIRVWHLQDIEAYESAHQEVRSQSHKRRKIVGYYLATCKGSAR